MTDEGLTRRSSFVKHERTQEWMMNISAHFLHTISLCEQRSGEWVFLEKQEVDKIVSWGKKLEKGFGMIYFGLHTKITGERSEKERRIS